MGPRECFLSILILGIMITYGSASRQYGKCVSKFYSKI
jgi:hypothetical protein